MNSIDLTQIATYYPTYLKDVVTKPLETLENISVIGTNQKKIFFPLSIALPTTTSLASLAYLHFFRGIQPLLNSLEGIVELPYMWARYSLRQMQIHVYQNCLKLDLASTIISGGVKTLVANCANTQKDHHDDIIKFQFKDWLINNHYLKNYFTSLFIEPSLDISECQVLDLLEELESSSSTPLTYGDIYATCVKYLENESSELMEWIKEYDSPLMITLGSVLLVIYLKSLYQNYLKEKQENQEQEISHHQEFKKLKQEKLSFAHMLENLQSMETKISKLNSKDLLHLICLELKVDFDQIKIGDSSSQKTMQKIHQFVAGYLYLKNLDPSSPEHTHISTIQQKAFQGIIPEPFKKMDASDSLRDHILQELVDSKCIRKASQDEHITNEDMFTFKNVYEKYSKHQLVTEDNKGLSLVDRKLMALRHFQAEASSSTYLMDSSRVKTRLNKRRVKPNVVKIKNVIYSLSSAL